MATQKSDNEREMLRELADGSESAFVWIFDTYSPKVYRLALKFLNSPHAAEEVVQDVFMDVWLRRKKMADVLNFGAYLHGMAKKQVFDAYRRKSNFIEMIREIGYQEQADNATERMVQEDEREKLLQEAVRSLPDHQRKIFQLAREEGLSHEAIAERMNLSRLAVKAHMKRILRFIRTRLDPVLKAETFFWLLIFAVK
ncbi:RNA polymerase sigma-70 factor (ECF subfamily) [Dyadobacter sp. BE34]|uniref:RNA polymerase sigma-70 factor (ECF subfamily) n=1 Tax=Dyadobacter fermentans TaxID=94254 RepID=A0ABU1QUG6_9BACT|nr:MULTISPECIES: sigma-70 family RNA polymerase sigma factor [Dyadobacter]MDR6804772.1 RNA polymerase sigma-70 factor (ECF subfamily) [Dyadobacter fermentans]MDR7043469.1 RNA polymerase sigma-70 factor (ECF subfamily) [Dyadobacter sp. BE242]MDR7197781.1 RNA polymerase sigma-70 factor (ECF subfamily) [Dyadobacter sp. BE34]MDR7214786.1 RNA polymerase sigma-70 factor (ECF subfamily) [Dyadobacter sp. BE31]MDR7262321.1 RNA polymerase sigma-70 factor (ECF subfamily) [Dyadobacter sp. BE32]